MLRANIHNNAATSVSMPVVMITLYANMLGVGAWGPSGRLEGSDWVSGLYKLHPV